MRDKSDPNNPQEAKLLRDFTSLFEIRITSLQLPIDCTLYELILTPDDDLIEQLTVMLHRQGGSIYNGIPVELASHYSRQIHESHYNDNMPAKTLSLLAEGLQIATKPNITLRYLPENQAKRLLEINQKLAVYGLKIYLEICEDPRMDHFGRPTLDYYYSASDRAFRNPPIFSPLTVCIAITTQNENTLPDTITIPEDSPTCTIPQYSPNE